MYQHVKEFQDFLKRQNAAAALLRLPENMVLFSQYWPRYGNSSIFIPASGKPYIICPAVEVEDTKFCNLDNVIPFGDVCIEDGDPKEAVISIIQRLSKENGIGADATIAIEIGEDVIAPSFVANKVKLIGNNTLDIIRKGFNTNKFIPVKAAIQEIRSIKSERDIEKLQTVNSILHKALDYFETLIEKPGIREIDVLVETECYFSKLASGYNNSRASRAFGQVSSGLKTSIAWADGILSDGRVLEHGDLVMYEIGACVDGYWADLTRTACVGGFYGQKKEIFDIVKGSFEAGVKAACDGALSGDVDNAAREFINKTGYGKYYVHPTGHGTGFAHNEGFPALEPGSKEILRSNMVVAVEPGIYIPEIGGIRIEENILVAPNGGIRLGL